MNKSRQLLSLGAVVLLLVMLFFLNKNHQKNNPPQPNSPTNPTTNNDRHPRLTPSDLHYHGKKVDLTKHAKCRMGCRHIDESEIQEILDHGTENTRKSKPNDKPCPSQALEGNTHDGQHVRIVVAECDDEARIVTVIDLENDFECSCD